MKRGIAVGGNIVVDYVKIIDSYPKQEHLSTISAISKSVGGAVPNVLLDLARMDSGISLQAIGLVGDDEDGSRMIELLQEHGIDTKLVSRDSSLKTSFSDVMTVRDSGVRTFFHFRGANQMLGLHHFDFEKIQADILHIGYALLLDALDVPDSQYGVVMARLMKQAQSYGLKTSLDVVSENSNRFSQIVPPSLKYCSYFIVNDTEASLTTEIPLRDNQGRLLIENMEKACSKVLEMGVNELVVIHAPEGAFAMDSRYKFYTQRSLLLPDGYIKGTVGAGDAFCAGVLYGLYREWDIQKSLQIGTAAAASCLSEPNATDGLVGINELEKLYEAYAGNKMNI